MTLPTGRLPHSAARLAATPEILDHIADLAAPPDRLTRPGIDYTPRMGDNDWASDCPAESMRECATVAAAVLGGYALNVAPTASLDFYRGCVGLPAGATRDQVRATDGCQMLAAAQRQWSGPGFSTGTDVLHGQFGTVPVGDRLRLAAAAATFGLGWWGIRLFQRDMDTFWGDDPWDDDGSDPGALIGLHAIGAGLEYTGLGDADEFVVVTYGRLKPTRWRWCARRLEEAHAFRWRQLDPSGSVALDEAALSAALVAWEAA